MDDLCRYVKVGPFGIGDVEDVIEESSVHTKAATLASIAERLAKHRQLDRRIKGNIGYSAGMLQTNAGS